MGFYYDNDNALSYRSKNGVKYDLLEGVAISNAIHPATSDILFIVRAYESDYPEYEGRIDPFVGYTYGATFIENPEYCAEYRDLVEKLVAEYEEKNGISK